MYSCASKKGWPSLSPRFFSLISTLNQNVKDFVSEISLNNDFPVFGAAPYATFVFDQFPQFPKVILCADKTRNQCYLFPASGFLIQLHPEVLLLWGKGALFVFLTGKIKGIVGGINHSIPFFPIVAFLLCHGLFCDFHGPYGPLGVVYHVFCDTAAQEVHKARPAMGSQSNHIRLGLLRIFYDAFFFGRAVIDDSVRIAQSMGGDKFFYLKAGI